MIVLFVILVVFSAGLALGFLIGWMAGRRSRSPAAGFPVEGVGK